MREARVWPRQHGWRTARQGPAPRTARVARAEEQLEGGPESWGACVGSRLEACTRRGPDAEAGQAAMWQRAECARDAHWRSRAPRCGWP
jgi:hypothetical protein